MRKSSGYSWMVAKATALYSAAAWDLPEDMPEFSDEVAEQMVGVWLCE